MANMDHRTALINKLFSQWQRGTANPNQQRQMSLRAAAQHAGLGHAPAPTLGMDDYNHFVDPMAVHGPPGPPVPDIGDSYNRGGPTGPPTFAGGFGNQPDATTMMPHDAVHLGGGNYYSPTRGFIAAPTGVPATGIAPPTGPTGVMTPGIGTVGRASY